MSTLNYDVTGERRKALVRAMSEILGEDPVYQGAPTFAYKVDGYTISRNGVVTCSDSASDNDIAQLLATLWEMGFIEESERDDNLFVVEMPRKGFSGEAYDNLQKIIASKASVLRKALGTHMLLVNATEDKLIFPWFTLHGLDGEADAYTKLISAICKMAKGQKRVIARERNVTNDKFTMRLFLIRLGFIGDEYKTARKILLRNLTGNSAWKNGPPPERRSTLAANKGGVPYDN